jgi:hypothetical protein
MERTQVPIDPNRTPKLSLRGIAILKQHIEILF